jgi:hypothetical protein
MARGIKEIMAHGIEEIFSTSHIVREHFSSNQNAWTWYYHSHGTACTVTFSQSMKNCFQNIATQY